MEKKRGGRIPEAGVMATRPTTVPHEMPVAEGCFLMAILRTVLMTMSRMMLMAMMSATW